MSRRFDSQMDTISEKSMRKGLSDTSEAAEVARDALLRELSTRDRLARGIALSEWVRRVAIEAIRRRHPLDSDRQIRIRLLESQLGGHLDERTKARLLGYRK